MQTYNYDLCPICGNQDLEFNIIEVDDNGKIFYEIGCSKCKKLFKQYYKFDKWFLWDEEKNILTPLKPFRTF